MNDKQKRLAAAKKLSKLERIEMMLEYNHLESVFAGQVRVKRETSAILRQDPHNIEAMSARDQADIMLQALAPVIGKLSIQIADFIQVRHNLKMQREEEPAES